MLLVLVNPSHSPQAGAAGGSAPSSSPRYSLPGHFAAQQCTLKVQIHDLSATGIGLISEYALENGTFLVITLRAGPRIEEVVRARVVHATEQNDGRWLLGCALTRSFTSEVLESFL